jgi:hypothetical protein
VKTRNSTNKRSFAPLHGLLAFFSAYSWKIIKSLRSAEYVNCFTILLILVSYFSLLPVIVCCDVVVHRCHHHQIVFPAILQLYWIQCNHLCQQQTFVGACYRVDNFLVSLWIRLNLEIVFVGESLDADRENRFEFVSCSWSFHCWLGDFQKTSSRLRCWDCRELRSDFLITWWMSLPFRFGVF